MMERPPLIGVIGAVTVILAAAVLPARAQQSPIVFRDFAMGGGNYYLRAPEFVDASQAGFLKADDRGICVSGEGGASADPARPATWHHGLRGARGNLPN